jgi:enoyl-CoA hydratase
MTDTPEFAFPVRLMGGVARIDLGRPGEGNMPTRSMIADLGALISRTGADPEVRVVVLEGRGASFCRGRDGRGESAAGLSPLDMRRKLYAPVLDAYAAINDCPVPVVALVHGDAIGFGAALATACDVTLASDSARFSFPEIEHDIPPTLAISGVMSKVPQKALTYLVYSAESVSATEAASLGIASAVFPASEFAARSEAFVMKLAGRPRIVLETIKRYQTKAPGMTQDMAAEYAGIIMALARTHK